MSTDYYFKKWNEVLKHLERITAIDVDLQVRSYTYTCIWHPQSMYQNSHIEVSNLNIIYHNTKNT